MNYATDGKCHNANRGTYGHECGKPATWLGTKANGYVSGFCDRCKANGDEARTVTTWHQLPLARLADVTRDRDRRDAERDDERAHVIFKSAGGDYCREEPPRSVRTLAAVKGWIARQSIPGEVTGYAVEWW